MLLRDPVAGQIQWRDITEFDRVTGLDQDNLIDELLARLDGAERYARYEVGADLTSRYQPEIVEEVLVSRQLDENAVERMRQHVFVESYSSLKKQASESGMPKAGYQDAGFQDVNEADDANVTRRSSDNNLDISHFPGGTHTGNFWHDIFETIDFSDSTTFLPVIRRLCVEYGFDNAEWEAALLNMVHRVVETDLSGFRLADISLRDALREMEFYLPYRDYEMEAFQRWIEASASEGEAAGSSFREVAGGEAAGKHVSEVGTQSDFNDVRHYLKGFIDLLVVHNGKYYILDYKSDKLDDGPQSYHPDALREHMKLRGYRNQYHYYSLALYLYLRDRLPDVDFGDVFGGVIYLYLRGIGYSVPDDAPPVTYGIFRDRPDPARIVSLATALQNGIISVEEQ
jgi:exodeoxyribonuclease V beta subunit